ncbi:transcriptional regulator [Achromobacter sp. HZ28]|nr:transcriptional regulator [Achromobacter sp. HZ34]OWT73158.1 transcriptional regulator [Achromobacter sp. HZ28]
MTHSECVRQILSERGMVRARDLTAAGVPLVYLRRLVDASELVRLARGLYQSPALVGEDAAHDLAEAARLVPLGVVSLLSALRHHLLTTQLPHTVWMTIPRKARMPDERRIRLEVVRATGNVLTAGVEHFRVEGVDVPVYGIAKDDRGLFQASTARGRGCGHRSLERCVEAKAYHGRRPDDVCGHRSSRYAHRALHHSHAMKQRA